MRKLIFFLAIVSTSVIFAQDSNFFDFGITAGYNYSSTDDIVSVNSFSGLATEFKSEKKSGYHVGLYTKFTFTKFYIRPEVVYTKMKSAYDSTDFDMSKIDVPILFGIKIIKPVSVFFGPSFQYILNNDLQVLDNLEGIDYGNLDPENDFGINAQAGIALHLGKQVTLDVRYEKGLADNLITLQNDSALDGDFTTLNAKPDQFILSLSLQL